MTNSLVFATFRQHPLDDDFWQQRAINTKYAAIRSSGVPILD